MPTIPQEQIDEIELEMADLVDELNRLKDVEEENGVLRAEVLRLRERLKAD